VKDRPILYTGPMVRKVLDGLKTKTRRVVTGTWLDLVEAHGRDVVWLKTPYGASGDHLWVRERQRVVDIRFQADGLTPIAAKVRYEADGVESGWIQWPDRLNGTPEIGKCLPYGGFRESSRITLGVEDVRAERLQDITDDDIRAEGVDFETVNDIAPADLDKVNSLRECWAYVWNAINGKRAEGTYRWERNPWVWVVSFRLLEVQRG